MKDEIVAYASDNSKKTCSINRVTDTCPICHHGIEPVFCYAFHRGNYDLQVVLRCPRVDCNKLFVSYYIYMRHEGMFFYRESSPATIQEIEFTSEINEVSPLFSRIFNQAKEAEERKLNDICGAGYRRALEFLIKDYLIFRKADQSEKIKYRLLGKCIEDYIDDGRLKASAKRAAWLGNDETHYFRKWDDKDLSNLKKLIELTVYWIQSEVLSDKFETEMPEKKK